jgi:hypothetical protein
MMRDRFASHKDVVDIDFNRKDEVDQKFEQLAKIDPALSTMASHAEQYPTFAETIFKAGLIAYSEVTSQLIEELSKQELANDSTPCSLLAGAKRQIMESDSFFLQTVLASAEKDQKSATAYWMLAALSAYNNAREVAADESKE